MKIADVFSDIFNAGINAVRPPIGSIHDLIFEVNYLHNDFPYQLRREAR